MSVSPHNSVSASPEGRSDERFRADFGSVRDEFGALTLACGLYDLAARRRVAISGADRVRWLNGMVTNNTRDLAAGQGVYAFLLNPQGHILSDLYAYNRGDCLVVDTDGSQWEKILRTFDHYIIMDDVEVAHISDKPATLGLAGPGAAAVLRSAGLEAPALRALQFQDLTWGNTSLTLVRTDNPAVESYELWAAPDTLPSLWQSLADAGAKPTGTDALELLRIASGVPRYGQDIRERDLPQETGQQRALHFSKGCYIGQEIVERIRSRGNVHRRFTGFEVQGTLPAVGAKIQMDGKDVGEVTSAALLPAANGQLSVALGYLRRELATPGKQLESSGSHLIVTHLPFEGAFAP
jgi:folate-binding protein YgfZ